MVDSCGNCKTCRSCGPCGGCGPACPPCNTCGPFGPCRTLIRGGVVYTNTDCDKRNGLQGDYPRSLCLGKSACCPPSGCCEPRGCSPIVTSPHCYQLPGCSLPSFPCCEVPVPIPGICNPCVCPPLMEGGVPDPRVWNNCAAPNTYPCYL